MMNQRDLMTLLKEAMKSECSSQRRCEIQCSLCNAIGEYVNDPKRSVIRTLLELLYTDTLQNRPELLPTLFPFFAIVCGDHEEKYIFADVDWSIME